MLRAVVITLAAVAAVGAAALMLTGLILPGLVVLLIWSVVALLLLVFERYRYKRPLAHPPGPDWQATTEKFVDPDTGASLTVYFKPSTGQRVYVTEPPPRA